MNENETKEVMTNEVENIIDNVVESNYHSVIKNLLANGCKRIKSLKIKNVTYEEKTTSSGKDMTQVAITLTTPIKGFVTNDYGQTWKEGMTNTIFTSLYAIGGAFKEDEELGWMANTINKNPKILNLILNGANIDVIQQDIAAGEIFVNPFSTRTDATELTYDHDVIINHVVKFNLGKQGLKMADKLADKLMDI